MTVTVILHEPGAVKAKYVTIWSRADADRRLGNLDGSKHSAISAAAPLTADAGEPTWEDAAWQ